MIKVKWCVNGNWKILLLKVREETKSNGGQDHRQFSKNKLLEWSLKSGVFDCYFGVSLNLSFKRRHQFLFVAIVFVFSGLMMLH